MSRCCTTRKIRAKFAKNSNIRISAQCRMAQKKHTKHWEENEWNTMVMVMIVIMRETENIKKRIIIEVYGFKWTHRRNAHILCYAWNERTFHHKWFCSFLFFFRCFLSVCHLPFLSLCACVHVCWASTLNACGNFS